MNFEDKINDVFDFNISEEVKTYKAPINEGIFSNIYEKIMAKLSNIDVEAFWDEHQEEILNVINKILAKFSKKSEGVVEGVDEDKQPITEDAISSYGAALLSAAGSGMVGLVSVAILIYAIRSGLISNLASGITFTIDKAAEIAKKIAKDKTIKNNPKMVELRKAQELRKAKEQAQREAIKQKSMPKGRTMPKPPPSSL